MNIRQKTLFPWTDWSYYVHFKLHTEFLITAHCKLPLKCTLTQNCGKIGVLTLSYFHFFIHELPNSIRLYFLKRGQPTKHRFYRRSKKKKLLRFFLYCKWTFLKHHNEIICNKEEWFLKIFFASPVKWMFCELSRLYKIWVYCCCNYSNVSVHGSVMRIEESILVFL